MCSVNRVAVGLSTATNSTPLSMRFARKAVAGQAIKASDHVHGARELALLECSSERGAI
jgi:hypothetical protein